MIRRGLAATELIPAEIPFLERARPEVFDQEVRFRRELEQEPLPVRLAEIERDRLLVAGDDRPPQRRLARLLPAPAPHRVALPRRLDLDDLGAHVAEQLPAERPGQQSAEFEHAQIAERAAFKRWLRHGSCIQSSRADRQPDQSSCARRPSMYTICAVKSVQRKVEIVEVGPRDGLQNEPGELPLAAKREFIERIVGCGIRRIEVASFVNPKRVPQMADADELVRALPRRDGVRYIGLVLNRRGFERALAAGCDEVGMVVVATDTFNQRNQGATTAESVAAWLEIARAAKAAGLRAQVTISAAFGCPFEGEVAPAKVVALATRARGRRARRDRDRRFDRRGRAGTGDGPARSAQGRAARHAAALPFPQHAQYRHCERLRGDRSRCSRRSMPASAASAAARSPRRPRVTYRPKTCSTCSAGWASKRASISSERSRPRAGSRNNSAGKCRDS